LLELARALDEPVSDETYRLAVVALGQRTRTLFRAHRQVARGGAADAAPALLRPMLEINIVIRFLIKDPDLHTRLWLAEADRGAMAIGREVTESKEMSERWEEFLPAEELSFEEQKEKIKLVRMEAIEAGLPVGETGEVFPSIAKLVSYIDEPAAREMYTLAYRELSWETHGGARAVINERFEQNGDGTASYRFDRRATATRSRTLAVSAFASALKLCGYHLGLGIEQEAELVLRQYVPQSPTKPKRAR
jgi:hypothetical protein